MQGDAQVNSDMHVDHNETGDELRRRAADCLNTCDPDAKIATVRSLARQWSNRTIALDTSAMIASTTTPGRPDRPQLTRANKMPRRGFGTPEGRAIMMHAIVHIEFNAINLALDAMQRFPNMPESYYSDWLQVAVEEAYHFELIRAHLRHLGREYGDYDAHGGLWEMCEKTAHDVLARMALVPRVLEARGLDVTPGIQQKLTQAGDHHAVSILDIILADEIGHVEIGNRWFRYCCSQRSVDPITTFTTLLSEFYPKGLSGPFNTIAREQAGFTEEEMLRLTANMG